MSKELSISGGMLKGQHIRCPKHNIRPAMAKIRNYVFQKIENYSNFQDRSNFLDLFSGSGVMAMEAISRGFSSASAVEKDSKKWHIIQQNFKARPEAFSLIRSGVELFILRSTLAFDVLYVDPPFLYKHKHDLLIKLSKSRLFHSKSLIILHVPSPEKDALAAEFFPLECITTKTFGGSTVLFFTSTRLHKAE